MLYKALGFLCVGIAMVGVVLPLLPTTPFLLLALACFARSSPQLQQKLLNHAVFGPMIHDWKKHKAVTRKTKIVAFMSLFISTCISLALLGSVYLKAIVLSVMVIPAIILYRLPVIK